MRSYERDHPAQLLVTLGDNDYTESPDQFAANWRASFGWLPGAGLGVAGALGNHDVRVQRGRYQFGLLGMPASYYVRRLDSVDVFVLDSTNADARQTRWLRSQLARSRAPWRIAVFHHPVYTCGTYSANAHLRRAWAPLFERYGVRLVLSGHDHNYQRFAPRRGVTYVVHGGGGARLYPLRACPRTYPRRVAGRSTHGFLHGDVGATRIVVRSVSLSGGTIDRFAVTKPAPGAVFGS